MNVAYRIETPRLVLRCWAPADAPLLTRAVEESLDHLRPWMPWIKGEPKSLEDRVAYMRSMRAEFDTDEQYVYGVFDRDEKKVLGGSGLHRRIGPRALEIGYWVHAAHVGQGLATELAAALTRVGFAVNEALRMEIHCDPANVRSAAVPRKLGYRHDATLRGHLVRDDGTLRDTMVWTMQAGELAASAAAAVETHAFDALGRPLALDR
jgi:RimJ/RimL family protein N-acetyltransferase